MSEQATTRSPQPAGKTRGQALVEFSLILPILLFVILGIIDYGRVLVIFANASSAIRDAARNATLLGDDGGGTPLYLSCNTIVDDASNVLFGIVVPNDVQVFYVLTDRDETDDTTLGNWESFITNPSVDTYNSNTGLYSGFVRDCGTSAAITDVTAADLQNGMLMIVTVETRVDFITPFLADIFEGVDLNFRAQRSVVTSLQLQARVGDDDYDGLDDRWELFYFGCVYNGDTSLAIRPDGTVVEIANHTQATSPSTATAWQPRDWDPLGGTPPTSTGDCALDADGNIIINIEEFNATDDPDDDGCNNGCEESLGLNPIQGLDGDTPQDTDGDLLEDGEEAVLLGLDANCRDYDTDGITPPQSCEDNPSLYGDGLWDGEEVLGFTCEITINGTYYPDYPIAGYDRTDPTSTARLNPKVRDSDGDGLLDGEEVIATRPDPTDRTTFSYVCLSDPTNPDTDGDGIDDFTETTVALSGSITVNGTPYPLTGFTDPLEADTDGDGLTDDVERAPGSTTDPLNPDTDGDTLLDGKPNALGYVTDPVPNHRDIDGDGLNDLLELYPAERPSGPTDPATATDPLNPNSDNDTCGLSDGEEVLAFGSNPMDLNSDGAITNPGDPADFDTLTDCEEVAAGTDLTNPNTDYNAASGSPDTCSDSKEIFETGTDPTTEDCGAANTSYPDNDTGGPDDLSDLWELANFGCVLNDASTTALGETVDNVALLPDGSLQRISDQASIAGSGIYDSDCKLDAGSSIVPAIDLYGRADDPDGDGCDNFCEQLQRTDPLNPDTDGDGLSDSIERTFFTNPRVGGTDTDGDGIPDGVELDPNGALGRIWGGGAPTGTGAGHPYGPTDPLARDSDGDGLFDGDELNPTVIPSGVTAPHSFGTTNPNSEDSDGDGLDDLFELELQNNIGYTPAYTWTGFLRSNPNSLDTDNDTLSDFDEVSGGTNPNNPDTDNDGASDAVERAMLTNPVNDTDSDDDGLSDGQEINGVAFDGTPLAAYSINVIDATGADASYILDPTGAREGGINTAGTSPFLDPSNPDMDGDGVPDGDEINGTTGFFTDPFVADTDGDGASDFDEINASPPTDPLDARVGSGNSDADGDGLTEDEEAAVLPLPTDPNDPDSDDDGYWDGEEVNRTVSFTLVYTDINGDPNSPQTGYTPTLLPLSFSTDGDIFGDRDEVENFATICPYFVSNAADAGPMNPEDTDTDGDGLADDYECYNGTNPLNGQDVYDEMTRVAGTNVYEVMEQVHLGNRTYNPPAGIVPLRDADDRVLVVIEVTRSGNTPDVDVTSNILATCRPTGFDPSAGGCETQGVLYANQNDYDNNKDYTTAAWIPIYDLWRIVYEVDVLNGTQNIVSIDFWIP